MFNQTIFFCLIVMHYAVTPIQTSGEMTLAMYQYLANHLTEEECRTLSVALHFRSFRLSNSLDEAESILPEDVNCLGLLLHWDKTPGEGKTASPEVVIHRLNQIGKKDLAEWLQRVIFSEFKEKLEDITRSEEQEHSTDRTEENHFDIREWIEDNDYNENVLSLVLICATIIVIVVFISLLQLFIKACKQKPLVIIVEEDTEDNAQNNKSKILQSKMGKQKQKHLHRELEEDSSNDQDEMSLLLP